MFFSHNQRVDICNNVYIYILYLDHLDFRSPCYVRLMGNPLELGNLYIYIYRLKVAR
jgi:hypothetical protein